MRYYFHLYDREGFLADQEGREFARMAAVRKAALKAARSIIGHDVENGMLDLRGRIEVADEHGTVVLRLPFTDAVRLEA